MPSRTRTGLTLIFAILVIGCCGIVSLIWFTRDGQSQAAAVSAERAKDARPALAAPPSIASPQQAPPPAQPALPTDEAPDRGLTPPLRAALAATSANAAEEREAFVNALRQSPLCTGAWCANARTTLQQWVDAAVRVIGSDVSSSAINCTDAGCWTVVTLTASPRFGDLVGAAQRAQLEHGWPGVSILGGPDLSRPGVVTSLWAVARP